MSTYCSPPLDGCRAGGKSHAGRPAGWLALLARASCADRARRFALSVFLLHATPQRRPRDEPGGLRARQRRRAARRARQLLGSSALALPALSLSLHATPERRAPIRARRPARPPAATSGAPRQRRARQRRSAAAAELAPGWASCTTASSDALALAGAPTTMPRTELAARRPRAVKWTASDVAASRHTWWELSSSSACGVA
jgi:hypothetical protein